MERRTAGPNSPLEEIADDLGEAVEALTEERVARAEQEAAEAAQSGRAPTGD